MSMWDAKGFVLNLVIFVNQSQNSITSEMALFQVRRGIKNSRV